MFVWSYSGLTVNSFQATVGIILGVVLPTVVLGCALIGILRSAKRRKEEEQGATKTETGYNLSTYTNYVVNIDEEESRAGIDIGLGFSGVFDPNPKPRVSGWVLGRKF